MEKRDTTKSEEIMAAYIHTELLKYFIKIVFIFTRKQLSLQKKPSTA